MVTVHGSYVQFRFYRPNAQAVHLAGEFNGWQEDQLRMVPDGSGYWLAVLRLAPGSYRFRYWADGQWYIDYAAFGLEYGPNGPDSVVRVAARPVAQAAPVRETAEETASRPVEGFPNRDELRLEAPLALAAPSAGAHEPRRTRPRRERAA